jgi:hypothetical protein
MVDFAIISDILSGMIADGQQVEYLQLVDAVKTKTGWGDMATRSEIVKAINNNRILHRDGLLRLPAVKIKHENKHLIKE